MHSLISILSDLLGLGLTPQTLTLTQMSLRAVIVCSVMYGMIRVAGRRFLAQRNPFDVLLAFLMASLISRAINGSTNFWATIALGIFLSIAYRLIAALASRSHGFGKLLKGQAEVLVDHGVMNSSNMKRHHVSEHDLHEDLRLAANVDNLQRVKVARLERSGEISVEKEPIVVEIKVEAGVQTVRLLVG